MMERMNASAKQLNRRRRARERAEVPTGPGPPAEATPASDAPPPPSSGSSDGGHPSEKGRGRRAFRPDPLWRIGVLFLLLGFALWLGWLRFERQVAPAFDRAARSAPTSIYAEPLQLRPGDVFDADRVLAHLEMAGYAPAEGPDVSEPGRYRSAEGTWRVHRRAVRFGDRLHSGGPITISLDPEGRVADIRDRNGAVLTELTLEPPRLRTLRPSDGGDRRPVPLADVPDHLVNAVLAAEDRRFRSHGGLDVRRTLAAAWENLRAGRKKEGGSTITQQLARTLLLDRDRTYVRKLREAGLALALERRWEKDRILATYLNHVYLGHVEGVPVYGVGAAAVAYFGKDVTELGLHESALLAALIRAPNVHGPQQDPVAARARRDRVLEVMRRQGTASATAARRAAAAGLGVRSAERRSAAPAPYFGDFAAAQLRTEGPEANPAAAGWSVVSTLSPALQRAAEAAIADGLSTLERAYPYQVAAGPEPLQAALVAIDPATGDVLAMVGGRDYTASQFNRAVQARRQPGSAFKPVVALAALAGIGFADAMDLEDPIADLPLTVETREGPWSPVNIDGLFLGSVSLQRALELSRNVPFARLGLELGPGRIAATARGLGIRSELDAVPSLALGSSEVTLLELTAAYATLASGGVRTRPRAIRSIRRPDGTLIPLAPERERAFPEEPVRRLTSALEGVVQRGTGRGIRERGYHGTLAAKSGTTNDFRDGWFVGYTPELVVGLWLGFDGGASLGLPANVSALPIFVDFLRRASELGDSSGTSGRATSD